MEYTSEILKVDTVLPSGRYYPREEVEKAIRRIAPLIEMGWLGELRFPLELPMSHVSHKVKRVWIDEDSSVKATIQTLPTLPMGAIVHAQLDGGNRLTLMARSVGTVSRTGVVTELEFLAVDIGSCIPAKNSYDDENLVAKAVSCDMMPM